LLVSELKQQKEALAAKEKELSQFEARLQSERGELNQLTQMVHQVQSDFDQTVTRVREQETANLKRLAKTYANMSPEAASAVFKALEETTLTKIVVFLKDAELAAIFDVLAKQNDAEAKRVANLCERLRLSVTDPKKNARRECNYWTARPNCLPKRVGLS